MALPHAKKSFFVKSLGDNHTVKHSGNLGIPILEIACTTLEGLAGFKQGFAIILFQDH